MQSSEPATSQEFRPEPNLLNVRVRHLYSFITWLQFLKGILRRICLNISHNRNRIISFN